MEYKISLTQQDLKVIFGALGEVPIKVGIEVVEKLSQAIRSQDEERARAEGVSLSDDVGPY